ncbi:MAG: hypothetical protein JWM80_5542 [Cyanobacteria bacterium RYN_339]|nr:hypothetical protein [Cyanobacteria bacterium RYN_339]
MPTKPKPKSKARPKAKAKGTSRAVPIAAGVIVALVLLGLMAKRGAPPPAATASPAGLAWNKDLDKGGPANLDVALAAMKGRSADALHKRQSPASAAEVLQAPAAYIGKVVALEGDVTSVYHHAPGDPVFAKVGGPVGEVQFKGADGSSINFIALGDTMSPDVGAHVTASGYLLGRTGKDLMLIGK